MVEVDAVSMGELDLLRGMFSVEAVLDVASIKAAAGAVQTHTPGRGSPRSV